MAWNQPQNWHFQAPQQRPIQAWSNSPQTDNQSFQQQWSLMQRNLQQNPQQWLGWQQQYGAQQPQPQPPLQKQPPPPLSSSPQSVNHIKKPPQYYNQKPEQVQQPGPQIQEPLPKHYHNPPLRYGVDVGQNHQPLHNFQIDNNRQGPNNMTPTRYGPNYQNSGYSGKNMTTFSRKGGLSEMGANQSMQKSQSQQIVSTPQMKPQPQPQDVLKNKQETQPSKNFSQKTDTKQKPIPKMDLSTIEQLSMKDVKSKLQSVSDRLKNLEKDYFDFKIIDRNKSDFAKNDAEWTEKKNILMDQKKMLENRFDYLVKNPQVTPDSSIQKIQVQGQSTPKPNQVQTEATTAAQVESTPPTETTSTDVEPQQKDDPPAQIDTTSENKQLAKPEAVLVNGDKLSSPKMTKPLDSAEITKIFDSNKDSANKSIPGLDVQPIAVEEQTTNDAQKTVEPEIIDLSDEETGKQNNKPALLRKPQQVSTQANQMKQKKAQQQSKLQNIPKFQPKPQFQQQKRPPYQQSYPKKAQQPQPQPQHAPYSQSPSLEFNSRSNNLQYQQDQQQSSYYHHQTRTQSSQLHPNQPQYSRHQPQFNQQTSMPVPQTNVPPPSSQLYDRRAQDQTHISQEMLNLLSDEKFVSLISQLNKEQERSHPLPSRKRTMDDDDIGYRRSDLQSNENEFPPPAKKELFTPVAVIDYDNKPAFLQQHYMNSVQIYNYNHAKSRNVIPSFGKSIYEHNTIKSLLQNAYQAPIDSVSNYNYNKPIAQNNYQHDPPLQQNSMPPPSMIHPQISFAPETEPGSWSNRDYYQDRSPHQAPRHVLQRPLNEYVATQTNKQRNPISQPHNKPDYFSNRQHPESERDRGPTRVTRMLEDIIEAPGRQMRPSKIVIILRGPPGCGKSFLAKNIKDTETLYGSSALRILALDDYFDLDRDLNMRDQTMVRQFEGSLLRSFQKTIREGFFPFIIVDCIHERVEKFAEMADFARNNGFQVYICELPFDVDLCVSRNIHSRTKYEIEEIIRNWEQTPSNYVILDATNFIKKVSTASNFGNTTNQGMFAPEIQTPPPPFSQQRQYQQPGFASRNYEPNRNNFNNSTDSLFSKWDLMDKTEDNLAQLDGIKSKKTKSMKDYLTLDDDDLLLFRDDNIETGKKCVKWADLEEKRKQTKMRAIGFVVGQTDWKRMMDPSDGKDSLTKTKYIERIRHDF